MKQGIGTEVAFMLYAVAILIDSTQFVLSLFGVGMLVSPFLGVVAGMLFALWFSALGVSMMDSRRIIRFLITCGAEFVPFIDMFPWWTITVWLTVRESRLRGEGL